MEKASEGSRRQRPAETSLTCWARRRVRASHQKESFDCDPDPGGLADEACNPVTVVRLTGMMKSGNWVMESLGWMIQKELFLFIKIQESSDTANSPFMNLRHRVSRLERGRVRHIDVVPGSCWRWLPC